MSAPSKEIFRFTTRIETLIRGSDRVGEKPGALWDCTRAIERVVRRFDKFCGKHGFVGRARFMWYTETGHPVHRITGCYSGGHRTPCLNLGNSLARQKFDDAFDRHHRALRKAEEERRLDQFILESCLRAERVDYRNRKGRVPKGAQNTLRMIAAAGALANLNPTNQ